MKRHNEMSWIDNVIHRHNLIKSRMPKKIIFDKRLYYVCQDKPTSILFPKPTSAGVYLIVKILDSDEKQILYVGKCKNFQVRMSCHEKIKRIKSEFKNGEKMLILFHETSNKDLIEIELIQKYRPPFNKSYNTNRIYNKNK